VHSRPPRLRAAVGRQGLPGLALPGSSGGRQRTSRRPWRGSATGGPVGDLDRVRRPRAGPVRIRARAVPADDLDTRVGGQPARQRLGVAAFEEVQRSAGLTVDQHRAIVPAAPDREVAGPEHPRGCGLRARSAHNQPQHDLPTRRDTQPAGQPRPRPARQRNRDAPQHTRQQRGLPRVADGQALDLPGERLALAAGIRTEEPPDGQPDLHPPAADRSIGQPPFIAAVDPARHRPAPRARRPPGHAPWPSPAAARPPPRRPRRSPRTGAARESPGQRHQSRTSTHHLATMTTQTPGRTAGLDNR
jgi:hypothetical protein